MPKCPHCGGAVYKDDIIDSYICDNCEVAIPEHEMGDIEDETLW